ncbi:DUF6745 domain-containing protein [Sphaerisporangium sp. NPDC049002]|uniref:DUF6745 domain-containing protein n=1 Tax=unclassified Sphaerisporangium TaxID=2630420 RepID=UPI0033E152CA
MSGRTFPGFDGTLTVEHEALVATVRDQWLRDGLTTAPVDRDRAEEAVRGAYRAAGLEPPRRTVWTDSPLSAFSAAAPFRPIDVDRFPFEDRLRDDVDRMLHARLGVRLWDRLRDQLKSRLWDQLWNGLRGRLRGQVLGHLNDRSSSEPCLYVWGALGVWGDAYWIALYTCALRVALMDADERLDALAEVTRLVGWWFPLDGAAVLCERPLLVRRDEDHRLHSATGPALAWPDGSAVYAWHGTRVPAWVVTTPTTDAILAEDDVEVRRCAIESLGWDRYVADAGLTLVAEAEEPRDSGRVLALYEVPERILGEPARVLLHSAAPDARDGVRRASALVVPAEVATPFDAAGWAHGLTGDQYASAWPYGDTP